MGDQCPCGLELEHVDAFVTQMGVITPWVTQTGVETSQQSQAWVSYSCGHTDRNTFYRGHRYRLGV